MNIDLSKISNLPTKVYFLEMVQPSVSSEVTVPEGVEVVRLRPPIDAESYIGYYKRAGLKYHWLDRLYMDKSELEQSVNYPDVHIFLLKKDSCDAGYIELVHTSDVVDIHYFGLFPEYVGKGLGSFFLNWGIRQGWSYGPRRLTVNTCDLDHSNALHVYQKAGFVLYNTVIENRRVLLD